MRRVVVCLVVAALSVAMPAGAGATQYICPDGMYPIPMSSLLVPSGQAKDKNGNGIVCVKYKDGEFTGGPDDRVSDDIVL
jgi:hypothetical protein